MLIRNRLYRWIIAAVFLTVIASPAMAHEFWLQTDNYSPKRDAKSPVSMHVGQFFKGPSFPYLSDNFVKFSVLQDGRSDPVKGLDGDDPAATLAFKKSGLAVVTFNSVALELTFEEWPKFERYLIKEGLRHIVRRHRAAGKPEIGIKEFYERDAKLLLDVGGTGAGQDRLTGMPLELVAERNPYTLAKDELLPVRLYYKGQPIAGIQITAIAKAAPKTLHKFRTDGQGRAKIPLPSNGPWLLNAVHMIEPTPGEGAHWFSLWASMVFEKK